MIGAAERIRRYLAERERATQLDPEDIHSFNLGHEREASLRVSDIRDLLALVPTRGQGERTSEEIQVELDRAYAVVNALNLHRSALLKEKGEVLVRESTPHEWTGRRVRRVYTSWGGGRQVQRGTVRMCGSVPPVGAGTRPYPGRAYVESPSGKTFYHMDGGPRAAAWELDE